MLKGNRRPFQLDWLISNLRWLLLIAVVVVALLLPGNGFEQDVSLQLIGFIVLAVVYNIILTFLLVFKTFPPALSWATLIADALLTVGLMMASNGIQSPFLFFGLLPIITAALRFSFLWSLLVAIFIVLGYFGVGFARSGEVQVVEVLAGLGNVSILILAALVSGLIARKMQQVIAGTLESERQNEIEEAHARRKQSRLIFELASTLSATLNYQRVLEAMLDVSEIGLQELTGEATSQQAVAAFLFRNQRLRVVASRLLTRRDQEAALPGRAGVIAEALANAEPSFCKDPSSDPELSQLVAMHRCKEAVAVPLRAGFESFGVVVFASPVKGVYTADYQDLLAALCNQAVVALQNARLYQNLMEEKERIVAVEEDARKKLARDLHDGPTQSIAAIAMRVNYTRKLLEHKPEDVMEELVRIEDLARMTTKEIRHMLFTLRPLILETQGLRAALEQYIAKRAETDRLPIHLDAPEGVDQVLEKDAQGVIFYIIEEAIGNARKHAEADNVWVRLRHSPGTFLVEIQDDGKGFDFDGVMESYSTRGSLGMTNMHERAELVNGRLSVESAVGKGTKITLRVPLRE